MQIRGSGCGLTAAYLRLELLCFRLRDFVLSLILNHEEIPPRSRATFPVGLPVALSIWKKLKKLVPIASAGAVDKKSSPRKRAFCAARRLVKSRKTGSKRLTSTPAGSQQASKSPGK